MAHVVIHLSVDLGLAAGLIGLVLVLALRNLVQHTLSLPVGALVDVLGPVRIGILACLLRAAGFTLLGTVSSLLWLVVAAVLLGTGGALFHPAAQSLLAGLAERRRACGAPAPGSIAAPTCSSSSKVRPPPFTLAPTPGPIAAPRRRHPPASLGCC
ncbi:MFS transporter [Streptosporangium soli]|nr:MFS transporter [Streptosporangium sp. KLBMP 9127]